MDDQNRSLTQHPVLFGILTLDNDNLTNNITEVIEDIRLKVPMNTKKLSVILGSSKL